MKHLILTFALFTVLSTPLARAAEPGQTTLTASLGAAFPSNNLGTRFAYGIRGGYQFTESFAAGLSASNSSKSMGTASILGLQSDLRVGILNAHLDALYTYEGLYLGGKVGITRLSSSAFGASGANTDFSSGAVLGYDIPLSEDISIGPSVEYIRVFADNEYGVVTALANLNFHF